MGKKIYYDPNSDIGRDLYFSGKFEDPEIHIVKNYVSCDAIILDVGANIGLHSIFLSGLVKNGLVIAFEPAMPTFKILTKNLERISNILPLNIAANDKTKLTKFHIASDNAYSSLKDTGRKQIVSTSNVLSVRLDDIIMNLELSKIDLVKIDVEGFEKNVLLGMEKVIERYRPVILCEIYQGDNSNNDPEGTIDLIASKEYTVNVFINGEITQYVSHNDLYYNYLFVPKV
jgi:FkbM family methyltransferase